MVHEGPCRIGYESSVCIIIIVGCGKIELADSDPSEVREE